MNIESMLSGGGGGLIASLGLIFGFHRRLSSHKEALKMLQESKVDTKLCDEKHKLVELTYEEVKYIRARIDDLVNSKKL